MPDVVSGRERLVALVTGGAHRVGRAIAVGLASDGYHLALHYHSSGDKARETAALIEGAGGSVTLLAADLARPEAPRALVREAVARCGRLDVVVNSAAVMQRMPVGEITAAGWDAVFDLNLRAPMLIAQEAAHHLPEGGSIINIADLAAFETWPKYLPHGASKAGLVYLTRALARVLAPRIRVNAVAPGTVLLPDGFDPAFAAGLTASTPLGRDGTPEDVVEAIRYLLRAQYVTGQTIVVDGGRNVRG